MKGSYVCKQVTVIFFQSLSCLSSARRVLKKHDLVFSDFKLGKMKKRWKKIENIILKTCSQEKLEFSWAQWLTPVIPALEAETVGSPEVRNLKPT